MNSDPKDLAPAWVYDATGMRRRLAEVVARGLTVLAAALALLLGVATAVEWALFSAPAASATDRFWLALGFAGIALVSGLLTRRGQPLAAAVTALVLTMFVVAWHSWTAGLGVYSATVSGIAILIAVAGMLLGVRAAVLMTLAYVGLVGAMAVADVQGLIDGRSMLMTITPLNRLVGQALVGAGGLLAAVLLHRLITRTLFGALAEQRRLAELLRIGSDWSWEMDTHAQLTYLSQTFEARTARTVAEFLVLSKDGGPQIVPDADWAALRLEMQARRPYRDRIVTFRCNDGTLLAVRGNGEPVHDARGRFVGWRGVSRNVTAERLAQREQQRTQAMFDRMVQMSPDAICVARGDGALLMVNHGYAEFACRPEAQLLGKSPVELGMWSQQESLRLHDAIARDGVVREFRGTVALPGRPLREVAITAGGFEWDGEPAAVITLRDITDVERGKLEVDAILDNASVGIALVRQRRFDRVNPLFETMFGHAVGTLEGGGGVTFNHDAHFAVFAENTDAALKLGQAIDFERQFTRADGSLMQVRLRARAVDHTRLAERGVIWVAEDVTERRRVERELAQAKVQAEAANEAKSTFLATMSHEIRTPLNGVLGLARLLQDETLEHTLRAEYLTHLIAAAELLTGIVSDVLDLSKIEAGHMEIEDIAFDLKSVVMSTFNTFAPLGRERGLQVDCVIDGDVAERVRGDPVRLRQILANYLSNALKFTAQGQIALHLSKTRAGSTRIEVRDSGPGVSAEVSARLFHPFVQADGSTTRRFGGTGLGLSICRELATRMGGSLGVESDGAHGSTFWAELPLVGAAAAPAVASEVEAAVSLAGLQVLVAEDNPVNMLIVCAMLERLGATPFQAEDGAQALDVALAHADTLHVVLMDLHMPLVDGLEATRRLLAQPRTAHLPVLALSAAALDNEREAARAAGMVGFIAKPVIGAELLRALRPWAERL